MEHEHNQDVLFEQRISKDLRKRQSHTQRQTFRKGVGLGFPTCRVGIFCLGLLDTTLLIVALTLGMYCAKAKDFKVASDSALAPLILERDFLRNHSDVFKERRALQAELEKQRRSHMQLQIQLKPLQTITDSLQTHIQALKAEKSQLESNRTALEVSCGRCPVGWIFLKTSCYLYSNNLSNIKKTWPDSRSDCISRGGDLLVINNLEEQKAINNNFPKIPGILAQWKMGFWIGLKNGTNGLWAWINNAMENDTMYWQSGQPVNTAGNCVAFGRNIQSWRSWYNRNCETDELHWICEMEPR